MSSDEVEEYVKDVVFMNIYNTSCSPPTKNQKELLNWVDGETECAFCKKGTKAKGLLHVVQASFNSTANSRPVRLIPGCQPCNKSFVELKLKRKTKSLKTTQTCSVRPVFFLE